MRFIHSALTLAAALGIATTSGAQERQKEKTKAEPKIRIAGPERCTSEDGKVECRIFRRADMDSVLSKRAALGVQLSSTGSVRDTIGVFVARVTPKGPAEIAGVVEGDRIVSINGVDLRVNAADAGDSYASGLPARRVTREMQKLTPGSRVNLRVWSGGRVRDVQVTAGRASDLRESGMFGMLEGMPGAYIMGDMPRFHMESFPRMRMPELEKIQLDLKKMNFEDFPMLRLEGLRDKMQLLEMQKQGLRSKPAQISI
jgi:hypothetical protein